MGKRVFIGVGHGGSDPGAVGYVVEKDVTLTVALAAKKELERNGVIVGISRTRDEECGITKECRMANEFHADVAIEVHFNAGGGDGFEAFVQTNSLERESRNLARCIESRVESIGQYSRGLKTKQGSNGDYFAWNRTVNCPAIILEGFFVDTADALDFETKEEQKALGRIYAYGVLDYLKIPIDTRKFRDVRSNAYYHDAVEWAVKHGITAGTSKDMFSPNAECTREQAATMLWAFYGKPARPTQGLFDDVSDSDYFANAVRWACSDGITAGIGDNRFGVGSPCTRAQIVTMLWAAAGRPDVGGDLPFDDVKESDYFAKAVKWAKEKGITAGVGGGKFVPHAPCNRAQMVCFLYKV